MAKNIVDLLGKDAESLLKHQSNTVKKELLHAPGPDFVDQVFVQTNRNSQVLRSLQTLFGNGRLANTGYLSILPIDQGIEQFSQSIANQLSLKKNLILLCGHYKGVDERVREHLITREISLGDYVLSGGELAAAVVADAVVRLIPGVLSDETSALSDSFQDDLIAPPVYTRPAEYKGWQVPSVLLSGHEKKIEEWRHEQAIERTRLRRPGLRIDE